MRRFCCFRFDVDTHVCVAQGIPGLLRLSESTGAKFTFFVNMGQAFDWRITAAKMKRRLLVEHTGLGNRTARKLGLSNSLIAVLRNPDVGAYCPSILRKAVDSGHEVGLHGGRNHARWERDAQRWSDERLQDEISWGLDAMKREGLPAPVSFASPGWNSPPGLPRLLVQHSFSILADRYDGSDQRTTLGADGLTLCPVNITGGFGNAGYLESMRTRGLSRQEILLDFRRQLMEHPGLAVVYEHPFFAVVHELSLLKELITCALDCGFEIRTIRETVGELNRENIGSRHSVIHRD